MRKNKFGIGAMLVAVVALVVALTGIAGALPGNKSVDANDLKPKVVKTKNLKNGVVTTGKMANGAVTAAKLGGTVVRTGTSPATQDSDGTQNGGAGPVAHASATATCQGSETLLSGGARWATGNTGANRNLYIVESYPEGKSWKATGIVDFGAQGSATLEAIAVCLK